MLNCNDSEREDKTGKIIVSEDKAIIKKYASEGSCYIIGGLTKLHQHHGANPKRKHGCIEHYDGRRAQQPCGSQARGGS